MPHCITAARYHLNQYVPPPPLKTMFLHPHAPLQCRPVVCIFTCLTLLSYVSSRPSAAVCPSSVHENRNTRPRPKWLGDDGEIVVELPREEEKDGNGGNDGGVGGGGGEPEGGESNGKGKGKGKAKPRRFTAVRVAWFVLWERRNTSWGC